MYLLQIKYEITKLFRLLFVYSHFFNELITITGKVYIRRPVFLFYLIDMMMERKGNIMKGRCILTLGIIAMVIMTCGIASAAKGLTLTTDKSSYNLEDVVTIIVTNNGDEPVVIPNGYVVTDETGKEVYHPPIILYMAPLQPGETYEYTWNQICDDGRQAPAGDYTIHTYWDSVTVKLFDSSTSNKGGRNVVVLPVATPQLCS